MPKLIPWPGEQEPVILVNVETATGPIALCDFASAGFDGSSYRSWLPRKAPRSSRPAANTRGAAFRRRSSAKHVAMVLLRSR